MTGKFSVDVQVSSREDDRNMQGVNDELTVDERGFLVANGVGVFG